MMVVAVASTAVSALLMATSLSLVACLCGAQLPE